MKANSFITHYEIIRELMHAVLRFGTVTPEQLDISPSKYNKMKPLLLTVMQGDIEDRRLSGKHRSLHITSDTFSEGLSALCNTYMVKSLKPSELAIRLCILQILQENKELTQPELIKRMEEVLGDAVLGLDIRTIESHFCHLAEYGQIIKQGKEYRLPENFFADLSPETIENLLDMVSCMRHFTAPSLCGEQLYNSLCDLFKKTETENRFLVKGEHIGYVLDDAVLYELLTAIEKRAVISFEYVDQYRENPDRSRILPLAVHQCAALGRRYLIALDLNDNDKLILCRLDTMKKVKQKKENAPYTKEETDKIVQDAFRHSASGAHLARDAPMQIRLQFVPEFEQTMRKTFPEAEYTGQTALVTVNHMLELKVFLRQNAEMVQAVPGESCGLFEDMQKEAKQWRERYGLES